MKIKNIVQIVTLAGLVASGSTQCMFVKGFKAVLQKAGTAIGVGLPTLAVPLNGLALYSAYKDPVKCLGETRATSAAEEAFLRQYIKDKNVTIRMLPDNRLGVMKASMTLIDKAIGIESHAFGASLPLSEALKQNNAKELAIYAAIAQHETKHAEEKHFIPKVAASTTIPIATTSIAATAFKKYFPANPQASLLKHNGRFGTKVVGGLILATINGSAAKFVGKQINHWIEYRADNNIASSEHKDGYITHLTAVKRINEANIPFAPNPKEVQEKIAFAHPPMEERIKRLQSNPTKTA